MDALTKLECIFVSFYQASCSTLLNLSALLTAFPSFFFRSYKINQRDLHWDAFLDWRGEAAPTKPKAIRLQLAV